MRPPRTALPVAAFELAHELHEGVDAALGERVVDGRAHAADRTVPLETVEPCRCRLLDERLLEFLASEPEGHVHRAAAVLAGGRSPEAGAIELRVQLARLTVIDGAHRFEAALRAEPVHDQPEH